MIKKNRIMALIGLMCLQAGSMNAMDWKKKWEEEKQLNQQLYSELLSEKGDPKRVTSLIESGADRLGPTGNGAETIADVAENLNKPALLRAFVTAVSPKQLYSGPKDDKQRDEIVDAGLHWAGYLMEEKKLPNIPERELRKEIEESYARVPKPN